MEHTSKYLVQLYNEGKFQEKEFVQYKEEMVRERKQKSSPYLIKTTQSLAEISEYAEKKGIILGIETRYYYQEIPSFDEFEILFSEIDSPAVFYWHDIGHAQAIETLGLGKHDLLLRQQAKRMAGMHIHDIEGMDDHRAPLAGGFSFERILPYVASNTIQVLEFRPTATPELIQKGLIHLEELLKDKIWSWENEVFQTKKA